MDFGMRDLNQEIIKFDYKKNFKDDDFYVSKSNKHIFELLNKWPKWDYSSHPPKPSTYQTVGKKKVA